MKVCPRCSNQNDDIAKTCTNCGAKLDVDPKLELRANSIYAKQSKQPRTQEQMTEGLVQLTYGIANDVSTIKGWVVFVGIIVLLTQLFGLLASCGVL